MQDTELLVPDVIGVVKEASDVSTITSKSTSRQVSPAALFKTRAINFE
jgi:hypothetical protein